jgi:hypothetical protein
LNLITILAALAVPVLARIFRTCLVAMALGSALAAPAMPHSLAEDDAASWYPLECCNNRDCQPVVGVEPLDRGLQLTTTDGRVIAIAKEVPRRTSLDHRWHICLRTDLDQNVYVICLFQPPGSS